MHKRNSKGLTLMEIIVSLVIISVALIGLANLFVAGKRYILHSRSRMGGGELGKLFLEPLQMGVRQDQWGNTCISQNGTNPAACVAGGLTNPQVDAVSGITYTPQYQISVGPDVNMRRVRLTVSWSETQP